MSLEQFLENENTIRLQNAWRAHCINLIASENVLSARVRDALGSDFAHRYAEGHPGHRYYEGTKYIDILETNTEAAVKEIFRCRHADVRPYSGNLSNEVVFSRFLHGQVVMVNSTPGGGHISHQKIGSAGKFATEVVTFPRSPDGFTIDVAAARDAIDEHKPHALVLGKSLILRPEPVADLAQVCKERGILVFYDAAHVLGLIGGGEFQQPLDEGADIMMGSTHKTFFGTQRGVILSNGDDEHWKIVDRGVFPGSTSNHHLDTLAAFSLCMEEWRAFGKDYARQVIVNAKAFAEALASEGFDVQGKSFGFTESHQVAVNAKNCGGGRIASHKLSENNIVCNMNMLPHEPPTNAAHPEGLRLGTQEMTRMGMKEAEMKTIARFMADCLLRDVPVGPAVAEFRNNFQRVHYSFDDV